MNIPSFLRPQTLYSQRKGKENRQRCRLRVKMCLRTHIFYRYIALLYIIQLIFLISPRFTNITKQYFLYGRSGFGFCMGFAPLSFASVQCLLWLKAANEKRRIKKFIVTFNCRYGVCCFSRSRPVCAVHYV